jgi:hypothetical protein
VIFCCLPGAIEKLHLAEILYRQTALVIRCACGLETAFAIPSILVAEHLEPSSFPVGCGNRSPVNDRGA